MFAPIPSDPLRVAFICTGNICRSPMAEVVVRHLVNADDRLRGFVEVTSAGTAKWHVGEPMDPRARRALDRAGFTGEGSPGAFASPAYLDSHDLIVVMTRDQRADVLERLTRRDLTVIMLRSLIEPALDLDLADPYFGEDRDFDACLETIATAGRRWTSGLLQPPGGDGSAV